VSDELFTVDLDILSAQTRSQLAALLRTIHLRADRPSLRTLEAITRHDRTPLTKTVVSEMLKGTRLPRKAVMVSFLRACGVPDDMLEPWYRAWERVAASEVFRSQPAVNPPSAQGGKVPDRNTRTTVRRARDSAEVPDNHRTRPSMPADSVSILPEAWAKQQPDPAIQPDRGGTAPGPLICRRELGRLMRALRTDAGMTIDQVATRLLISPSKVSRIETSFRSVPLRDVRDLCDLYQVTGSQRDYLLELAREGRRKGWWQSYDLQFAAYIGLEAGATSIKVYHATVVPGLLQTADYAHAIATHAVPLGGPDRIQQAVDARLRRQRLLTQSNPPQLHVIIDEAALWRIVGHPAIMKAQLESIVKTASLPNVTVQVIPYDAGAYPALDSSFTILDLPSPMPGIVYVEGLFGFIYLQNQQDIDRFQQVFLEVQEIAATEQQSIALITTVSKELDKKIQSAGVSGAVSLGQRAGWLVQPARAGGPARRRREERRSRIVSNCWP
jgi:transcriptional regulator with XRE-family HTH domain